MLGTATLVAFFLFTRDCRHRRWCFLTGAMIVSTTLVASALLDPFIRPGDVVPEFVTKILPGILFLGVLGGVMGIGMAWLTRLVFGRAIVASGPACPDCGYDIRHLPQARCPECGRQLTLDDLSSSAPPVVREWRRFALITVIVAALSGGVYLSYPYVLIPAWIRGWAPSRCVEAYFGIRSACSERILAEYIRSGDDDQRAAAANEIGSLFLVAGERRVASDTTVDVLRTSVLHDPVPYVRQCVVISLEMMDRDLLFAQLPDILRDTEANMRYLALVLAARRKMDPDPRGTPFLIQALDDPDPKVRAIADELLRVNNSEIALPYDPNAPREQRLEEQAGWQAWWDEQPDPDRE